jgi:3D (Asp-Asp-Asp) domain-containing protein
MYELLLVLTLSNPVAAKTTGYCPTYPCVNRRAEHGITKSGRRARRGTCAADWSVYPAGHIYFIKGYGLCRIEDTGRVVKGRHLDLYFDTVQEARDWGVRYQLIQEVHMESNAQELERLLEDQFTIGKWATENFGKPNILAVLRRSCDELLEAMEECVVQNEATRTMFKAMRLGMEHLDKYKLPDEVLTAGIPVIAAELADSEIVNKHAAAVMGVNLDTYVQNKMTVNRRRKWKQNKDGTGQHVDEDIVLNSIDQEEA